MISDGVGGVFMVLLSVGICFELDLDLGSRRTVAFT